jgi:hypothetical protein
MRLERREDLTGEGDEGGIGTLVGWLFRSVRVWTLILPRFGP